MCPSEGSSVLPPWRFLSSEPLPLRLLDLPLGRPFSLHQDKIPLPQTTRRQPLLQFEFLSCGDFARTAVSRQHQFEHGASAKKRLLAETMKIENFFAERKRRNVYKAK